MKPLICAPMGDPAGVGPEILAASLADSTVTDMARVLVVGNTEIIRRAAAIMKATAGARAQSPGRSGHPAGRRCHADGPDRSAHSSGHGAD